MDDRPDETDPREQRFHEVLGAYLEAEDAGWAPEPKALITSYPDLAKKLEAFFVAQSQVAGRLYPRPVGGRQPGAGGDSTQGMEGFGAVSRSHEPRIGDQVGDYVLEELIKEGGQGKVFKARQKTAQAIEVALKMIKKSQVSTPKAVRAIIREAEAIANLDHPQIVPIRYVGVHEGLPYFSMKYFESGSLQKHLQRFEGDQEAAARLLVTAARAVQYAHEHSFLHRDLKPGNILLDGKDQPVVADFGLAKLLPAAAAVEFPARADGSMPEAPDARTVGRPPRHDDKTNADGVVSKTEDRTVTAASAETQAGAFIGTKGYAPPENTYLARDSATVRADVFGLGAILYRLLTGIQLFDAEKLDIVQYTYQVRNFPAPAPRQINPKVNERLEAVCLKSVKTKPGDRYATPAEFADDLELWLAGKPPKAWPMPWWMRLWHAVLWHLPVILAAMGLGFGLATMFFVLYWIDPDRVPRGLEAKARAGRLVLIGATGPPAWSRWNVGDGTVLVSPEVDKPYSFTTEDHARLELLRKAPGPRYRFKAEVRHERSVKRSSVAGIYFAHLERNDGADLKRYWCEVTFADVGTEAVAYRGPDPKSRYAAAKLTRQRFELPAGDRPLDETGVKQVFLAAEGRQVPDWRTLEILVRPENVQVTWENELLPAIAAAKLQKSIPWITKGQRVETDFEFVPDGGLGLYVYSGKASFRNVIVEPLD